MGRRARVDANADCRVEKRAHDAGTGADWEASADMGQGRGEERTENIPIMPVTLEVMKLSGWLNADAPCRESKAGEVCGSGGSRRWTTAAHAACKGGRGCRLGRRARREERT